MWIREPAMGTAEGPGSDRGSEAGEEAFGIEGALRGFLVLEHEVEVAAAGQHAFEVAAELGRVELCGLVRKGGHRGDPRLIPSLLPGIHN